ncbi:dystonin-like [Apus apus]|uniref:dystonin-like n=1 Tax=Apus apus TaxID=8895 RepID=UPI0021F8C87E|nr:dystonin-like [Apus apus]
MGNAVSRPSCLGQKSRRPEELPRELQLRDVGLDTGQPPGQSIAEAPLGPPEKPPVENGWSPAPGADRSPPGSPVLRRSRSEVTVPNGGTGGVLVGGAATWTPPRAGAPRGTWSWKPLTTREVTEVTEVTETIVTEIVEVTEYPAGEKGGEPLVTRTVTVLTELVAGQTDATEVSLGAVPMPEEAVGVERGQDTLESLLVWVADMEELVGNQKPPSAEVKVAKAQLEEQKLLKRLLEERRPRVELVLQDRAVLACGSTEHGSGTEHGSSTEHGSGTEHSSNTAHDSSADHGSNMEHSSSMTQDSGMEHGSDTEHGSGAAHGSVAAHGSSVEHGSNMEHSSSTAQGSGTAHSSITPVPQGSSSLSGLGPRWEKLVQEAESRYQHLERILPAAQAFQETTDSFQEWLGATERQVAQLWHHNGCLSRLRDAHQHSQALCEEIRGHLGELDMALERGQRVLEMVTGEEARLAQEKLEALRVRYLLLGQGSADARHRLGQTLEASSRLGTAQEDLALWLSRLEQELASGDSHTGGQELSLSDSDREKFQQILELQLSRLAGLDQRLEEIGQVQLDTQALCSQLSQQKLLSAEVLLQRGLVERLLRLWELLLEPLRLQLQPAVQALRERTEQLWGRCGASAARLERAQALLDQFAQAQQELEPWLEEAQELGGQLVPEAISCEGFKEQQALLQCLREALAEHRPVLGQLQRAAAELSELSPAQGARFLQRGQRAEERYGALRQRLRQASALLEDALPRYSQLSERMSLLLECLERVRSRLQSRPSVRGDAAQLRERLRENSLALGELEKLGVALETVQAQGSDLLASMRAASFDSNAGGLQERVAELGSLWGSLRGSCQEQEQWLRDLLAQAERFWPSLAELALALGDTQQLVLGLEEPGPEPEAIRAQLHTMQALREEVDSLQGELDALGSLGVELMSHCGDPDRPDVTRSLDELYSSWHSLNRVWGERFSRLEEQLQGSLRSQEAVQRLSAWLDAAELRVAGEGTFLLSGDPELVQQQLAELKEFKRELYQCRVEVESLRHRGGCGQGGSPGPPRDLQRRWDRLEEEIVSRQHQLEAALLGLGQFRHQLEELLAWLARVGEQLQGPVATIPDLQHCEVELAKHKVLRNDVMSHARTVQSVSEAGQGLLVASLGDSVEGLQQGLQQLHQCWDLVQTQTESRQLELENNLSQVQDITLEITELLQWLEQVELQLCFSKPAWGHPETTREELAAHVELCRALESRQEAYVGLRGRLQRLLVPGRAGPCSTEHSLRLLEQKWASVQAEAQDRKEQLAEGLRLSTEFQGTAQELLRWLAQAEELLGSPEPPSVVLDTVTAQIREHKALEQEAISRGEQLSSLEAMATRLRDSSRKQDGAVTRSLVLAARERLGKVLQRAAERGAALEEARKRSKEFMESRRLLLDWMDEVEPSLEVPGDAAGSQEEIKGQLVEHKAFQRLLRAKRPVYEATVRSGRALREGARSPRDRPPLEELLGELKERWDGLWSRAAERQQKLEQNLLFSGKFSEALQALMDWLYRAEPQLSPDAPLGGDRDLVGDLMDKHKVFQKELGQRAGCVRALQRWARDPARGALESRWLQQQLEELGARWELVCRLSLGKQARLEAALRQAEEFHTLVHTFLGRLSESEKTLKFGVFPEEEPAVQECQEQLQVRDSPGQPRPPWWPCPYPGTSSCCCVVTGEK